VVVGLDINYVKRDMDATDRDIAIKMFNFGKRETWEQVRLLCYHIVSPYMKKAENIKTFMPFEWDKKKSKEAKPLTKKEFEELKKRHGLR